MKIIFISNFHNHHQIPLCDEFVKNLDVEFRFIATEKVPEDRIKLGYKHEFSQYDYYSEITSEKDREEAEQDCFECDVLIIGECNAFYAKRRQKAEKLTFYYSERFFKEGFFTHPGDVFFHLKRTTFMQSKKSYMLCSSAYTAHDCSLIGAFPKKRYRWGYFPEVINYNFEELVSLKGNGKVKLLWVGRYIDWKHPDDFIKVCGRLAKEGYEFSAEMIGSGEMLPALEEQRKKENLTERVKILSSMTPEEVRVYMTKADIFLFTSDYKEGWGAVLGEALNSGCTVIASRYAGSSKFLINDGINGVLYTPDKKCDELFSGVKRFFDDDAFRQSCMKQAYETMTELWNPCVAAERFYLFAKAVIDGSELPVWKDGPMSQIQK